MSAVRLCVPSLSRSLAAAFAELVTCLLPISLVFFALLASGCTSPATNNSRVPAVQGVLTRRLSGTPTPAGNGSGAFSAAVADSTGALPSFAGSSGSYDLALSSGAHSLASGQAFAAPTTDELGNPYWIVGIGKSLAGPPSEMLLIAVPDSRYAPGTVSLDGSQAIAYLVDSGGNPLVASSTGSVIFTDAPRTAGKFAAGSFTGEFALVPPPAACASDADCRAGQSCRSGQCTAQGSASCRTDADCAPGTSCDPTTGSCFAISASCRTNGDCPAGQACDLRTNSCVSPGGCSATGCPAGLTCDPYTDLCTSQSACRTDAECGPGQKCLGGECLAQQASGLGNCFSGGSKTGQGSYSGDAGGVASCSAIQLGSVSGGPQAALTDGMTQSGNQGTMLVIGDLSGQGDRYLVVELDRCPAPGATLSAPASRFLLVTQTTVGDTLFYAQKTASAGTLTVQDVGGAWNVAVTATFGSGTVTATATLR